MKKKTLFLDLAHNRHVRPNEKMSKKERFEIIALFVVVFFQGWLAICDQSLMWRRSNINTKPIW